MADTGQKEKQKKKLNSGKKKHVMLYRQQWKKQDIL